MQIFPPFPLNYISLWRRFEDDTVYKKLYEDQKRRCLGLRITITEQQRDLDDLEEEVEDTQDILGDYKLYCKELEDEIDDVEIELQSVLLRTNQRINNDLKYR